VAIVIITGKHIGIGNIFFMLYIARLWQAVSEEEILKIGQSETRIACGGPCLVMDHNKMCTL
jgi:hypothetical protein